MLGAFDYQVKFRQGKANANADALGRPTADRKVPKPEEVVHLMEHLSTTPLTSTRIKSWTDECTYCMT